MEFSNEPGSDQTYQDPGDVEDDTVIALAASYRLLRRHIVGWVIFLIVFSLYDLASSTINYAAYYVLIIFLAILMLFFRSSFMWIVLGIYVFTEGVTQLLIGAGWQFIFMSVVVVSGSVIEYLRFNKIERLYREVKSESGGNGLLSLPELGGRLSITAVSFGWLASCASFTLAFVVMALALDGPDNLGTIAYLTLLELGTLGLGFGAAALLAGTPKRLLAVAGIIPGVSVWLFEMVSVLFWE